MVLREIALELEPWSPIFEKCSHLRDKGGVLTLRTPVGFVLTHTVNVYWSDRLCGFTLWPCGISSYEVSKTMFNRIM